MNFLQICQRARQECSISGSGPASVVSQTGENDKIVDWVLTTYEDVQDTHPNWHFLRTDFSWPSIANTSTYLPSAVSLSELQSWKKDSFRSYLTAGGVGGQQRLSNYDWDYFRDLRQIGTIPTGQPTEFAIRPDKSVVLWPTPDAIYTITGEYWKRAQTMSANADEPLIPAQFQMILVWGAVRYYAADQGAAELFAFADDKFKQIMRRLEKDQLLRVQRGGPLA